MPDRSFVLHALVLAACLSATSSQGARFFAASGFQATANPSAGSPWSYGYSSAGLGTYLFKPFAGHPAAAPLGVSAWLDPSLPSGSSPVAWKNDTLQEINGVLPGAMALNTNDARGIASAVLRFTAPSVGCFWVRGTFHSGSNWTPAFAAKNGQAVAILLDERATAPMWSAANADASPKFDLGVVSLGAGQKLDFVVTNPPGRAPTDTPVDVAVLSTPCPGSFPQPTFDAAVDFQVQTNPGSVWSYGYSSTADWQFKFVAFDAHPAVPLAGTLAWMKGDYNYSGTPAAWVRTQGSPIFGVQAGQLALHPGPSPWGDIAVLRFTPKWSGCYSVRGSFGEGDVGAMSGAVLRDANLAAPLWSAADTRGNPAFSFPSLYLDVSETLEFVVGNNGNYNAGNTPVDAKIAPVSCPTGVSALAFDAASDFGIDANGASAWTYGYSAALSRGYSLIPFDAHPSGAPQGSPAWFKADYQTYGTPAAWKNDTRQTVFGVAPGQMSLHPGPLANGDFAVLRFTAPVTGRFRVTGQFYEGDTGETDARIFVNGDPTAKGGLLRSFATTNGSPTFDWKSLSIVEGHTLDFAVGNKGPFASDNTPVKAVVVPILPVPAGEGACDRSTSPPVNTVSTEASAVTQRRGWQRVGYYVDPLGQGTDVMLLLVEDAPGLPDDQVLVELDIDPANGVRWPKSLEARRYCHGELIAKLDTMMQPTPPNPDGTPIVIPPINDANDLRSGYTFQQPWTMRLKRDSTREIWMRKPGFLGIWMDVGVLDSSFWSALGGRRARFIWRWD